MDSGRQGILMSRMHISQDASRLWKSRRGIRRQLHATGGNIQSRLLLQQWKGLRQDISNERLNWALQEALDNAWSPHTNQRERHEPKNKTSVEVLDIINEHIRSFPQYTSHCSRSENPNRRYLSPDLSIAKMYSLYCTYCSENDHAPASEWVIERHIMRVITSLLKGERFGLF